MVSNVVPHFRRSLWNDTTYDGVCEGIGSLKKGTPVEIYGWQSAGE